MTIEQTTEPARRRRRRSGRRRERPGIPEDLLARANEQQEAFNVAEAAYENAARARNLGIIELLDAGYTQEEVAEAFGITRSRVQQVDKAGADA